MKILFVFLLLIYANFSRATVPQGFVDLSEIDSSIYVEMRYHTNWNFTGRKIAGYQADKCYLTEAAAKALAQVQKDLMSQGYSLLVLDCYRPQKAVNDFVKWAADSKDHKMKKIFYPDEPKEKLFEKGYIAEKSGHTRGSTIDLTIVKKSDVKAKIRGFNFQEQMVDCRKHKNTENSQLNMGTSFDCFSVMAHTDYRDLPDDAKKNRMLLKNTMQKFGFENYPQEWWHYTLKDEPFKDRYFDFDIQ